MLRSIGLTHVQYDESTGVVGKALAYASLVPVFLVVSYAALIAARRDIATIYFVLGQLVNEIYTTVLKELIQQPRPGPLGNGYGMPSRHAQFAFFAASYITLYLVKRVTFSSRVWNWYYAACAIALALIVSYSRVYLNYHTTAQVMAGIANGTLAGYLWFHASGVLDYVVPLLHTDYAAFLYLKDTRKQKNVFKQEYDFWVRKKH